MASRDQFEQYHLASRWPLLWRTKLLSVAVVSLIYGLAVAALLVDQLGKLQANDIPDFHFWFLILSLFSFLLTAGWLSATTKHFDVGSAGYRIRSPVLPLLVVTIGLLWLPTFSYAYFGNKYLASLADAEVAGSGYLRMQRVASLFGAAAHYEQLKLADQIPPLEGQDSFTAQLIKNDSIRAVGPIEIFAPALTEGILVDLIKSKLVACAGQLDQVSKAAAVDALRNEYAQRASAAQTQDAAEEIRRARASALDETQGHYDSRLRSFQECTAKSIAETNVNQQAISSAFRLAQRNAYLIYYANKGFGANSADYQQFTQRGDFAATGLTPFLGDSIIFACICWLIFFTALIYRAMEYAGPPTVLSVLFRSAFIAMVLALASAVVGFNSTILQSPPNPLSIDMLASFLHWPSLFAMLFTVIASIAGWFGPSTGRTRSAMLAAFLCLPVAIAAESLNAVNALSSFDYAGSGCPSVAPILGSQIQCVIYKAWQPSVRAVGSVISELWAWDRFWTTAAARVVISLAVAVIASLLAAAPLLFFLKREFVRPRQA